MAVCGDDGSSNSSRRRAEEDRRSQHERQSSERCGTKAKANISLPMSFKSRNLKLCASAHLQGKQETKNKLQRRNIGNEMKLTAAASVRKSSWASALVSIIRSGQTWSSTSCLATNSCSSSTSKAAWAVLRTFNENNNQVLEDKDRDQ